VSVLATRASCTTGGRVESDLLEYRGMQVRSENDPAGLFSRIVAETLPSRSGLEAWRSLLHAHATLVRRLELELAETTGLALADFDVLAQLALAGGELRMTDLANRALISRSGMTRRVSRLVNQGLVGRANVDGDARGVVVALTDAGVTRLAETAPVHVRGVAELFVSQLDEQELAALKSCLDKVIVDCEFG
jgi:DNA-binding MarR family transcriptional regulator